MFKTQKPGSSDRLVVVAKLLTGYLTVAEKVADPAAYLQKNATFDGAFAAHVAAFQGAHGLGADSVIGPKTWTAIAAQAQICSTSKNRISAATLALQFALDSSITADAIYGNRTRDAVAAFQAAKGIKADGICGPKTWSSLIVGTTEGQTTPTHAQAVRAGTFVQPTDYKQGAKPWGPKMYSNHNDPKQTMANSGCGPTSAADIIHFTRDSSIDPYDLAMMAVQWGDRTNNSGTSHTFFTHLMAPFNYPKMVATKSVETLKACLDAGGYAVANMGKGYWTNGGHYITPWKYDATYVYCNDPASSRRVKQKWGDFQNERKQFFCFFPNEEPKPAPEPTPTPQGDKICDVSRFQGVIDWDKLAPELAFVVIKASGLYRNGADTQYANNVRGAVSHGVPFHVFSYLYCLTEAEAKRDAKLYFDTVKAEGHWPLFWVLDLEAGWGIADKDAPRIAQIFEAELRRLCREQGPGEIRVAAYVANQKYNDWAFDYSHYDYVWIPKYTTSAPTHPCDLWQYTSHGQIAGINHDVDLDRLMGTKPIEFFTGGAPAPEPAPTPGLNKMVEVTGGTVNVRSAPGTNGTRILGVVYKGDRLPYQDVDSTVDGITWHLIEYETQNGWISGKYSRVVD